MRKSVQRTIGATVTATAMVVTLAMFIHSDTTRARSSSDDPSSHGMKVGPDPLRRLREIPNDFTALVPGETISEIAVRGTIFVAVSDVTIRNFTARNVEIDPNARNVLLERGRIDGLGDSNNMTDGVAFGSYTARALDISHQLDGFKAMGDVVIEDCWVHDLNGQRGSDAGSGGYSHNDAVQVSGGSNITIRRNRFERPGLNSAVFIDADQDPISDVTVEDNFLDGGTFTLYVIRSRTAPRNGMPSDVVIRNNVFGHDSLFGPATIGPGVVFTANTDEDGHAIQAKLDEKST